MASRSPRPSSSSTMFTRQNYFLAYNGISLALWGTITLRTMLLAPALFAHGKLFGLLAAMQTLVTITQTLAVLEVVHAALGIVRANPITTAMQVASRLMVVWGVLYTFPEIVATTETFGPRTTPITGKTGGPLALAGCLTAWGITECIRYGFFVWKEGFGGGLVVPPWLTWLRYNTFFVLYPVGISSECWLMYLASKEAGPAYTLLLKTVLLIYVPGSYILYTHMMSQRRRVMKGKAKIL